MCGIVGFISKSIEKDLIEKLTSSISHRGPDKSDYKIIKINEQYIHLGSARLAINGLGDGNMPMEVDENFIVYNGELFDPNNINSKLKNPISTSSDTRILISYLNEKVDKNYTDLNGMYAFAYVNTKSKELILSRDYLGIKPLYYSSNNEYPLIFSSEIKPLIVNNLVKNTTDLDTIYKTLAFGGNVNDESIIKEINKLNPGSCLIYKNHSISIEKFSKKKPTGIKNFNKEEFINLFSGVVKDHLSADVDVNILLSGGLDSTLIAYFAKYYFDKNVTAFTLSYNNQYYDESPTAKRVANKLGINYEDIFYNTDNNSEVIEELLNKLPEPILDPSIVPTYYLSKEVSKFTKAVLSGDGADEIFGGYAWYRAAKLKQFMFKYKLNSLVNLNPKINSKNNELNLINKFNKFFSLNGRNIIEQILIWQNLSPFLINYINPDIFFSYANAKNYSNNISSIRKLDIETYMYTNILPKSDTASMLNGLEVRPPFLDMRIYEYGMNLKFENQFSLFNTKISLRNILRDFDTHLASLPKHGFTHNFDNWSQNDGVKFLKSFSNDFEILNNFLDQDKNYYNSFDGIRDVWKLYSMFKWLEINNTNVYTSN